MELVKWASRSGNKAERQAVVTKAKLVSRVSVVDNVP